MEKPIAFALVGRPVEDGIGVVTIQLILNRTRWPRLFAALD
jgi:hypothetical protein